MMLSVNRLLALCDARCREKAEAVIQAVLPPCFWDEADSMGWLLDRLGHPEDWGLSPEDVDALRDAADELGAGYHARRIRALSVSHLLASCDLHLSSRWVTRELAESAIHGILPRAFWDEAGSVGWLLDRTAQPGAWGLSPEDGKYLKDMLMELARWTR